MYLIMFILVYFQYFSIQNTKIYEYSNLIGNSHTQATMLTHK